MHHNGATATVANAAGTAGNVNGVGLRRANGPVAAAAANGISSPAPSKLFELSKTVNRFYYGGKTDSILLTGLAPYQMRTLQGI